MRPNEIRPLSPYKDEKRVRAALFHGTWAAHLGKGDSLIPSAASGNRNFNASNPSHVYMTDSPDRAQQYANDTYYDLANKDFMINGQRIQGARPTVYRVQPKGKLFEDDEGDILSRAKVPIIGTHWQATDDERKDRISNLIFSDPEKYRNL